MRKLSFLFLAVVFIFSCNNSNEKSKKDSPTPGQQKVVASWTNPDSTKNIDVMLRVIKKDAKYDSAQGKDVVVIDTLWGYPVYFKVDSTGQKIKDTSGKVVLYPQAQDYYAKPKDSVNWRIAGIPIDKLLDRSYLMNDTCAA